MPNWVQAHVKIEGSKEDIQKFKEYVKSEEKVFDFDKIITMPEEIKATMMEPLTSQTKIISEKTKQLIVKHGSAHWYEWSNKNWGTKWNCSNDYLNEDDNIYSFRTAWSFPFPIFEKLSSEFPEIKMNIIFADEDFGVNCGAFSTKDGEIIDVIEIEDEEKAVEFAEMVWGFTEEEQPLIFHDLTKYIEM